MSASMRYRHDRPRRRDGRHLELLEGAGLVEVYVNADVKQAMRLTDDGGRVARQMVMSDDPDAVLDALLAAQSKT